MTTSKNHVPQKAKLSQQIFCLIDKSSNCLAGHGRAGLK